MNPTEPQLQEIIDPKLFLLRKALFLTTHFGLWEESCINQIEQDLLELDSLILKQAEENISVAASFVKTIPAQNEKADLIINQLNTSIRNKWDFQDLWKKLISIQSFHGVSRTTGLFKSSLQEGFKTINQINIAIENLRQHSGKYVPTSKDLTLLAISQDNLDYLTKANQMDNQFTLGSFMGFSLLDISALYQCQAVTDQLIILATENNTFNSIKNTLFMNSLSSVDIALLFGHLSYGKQLYSKLGSLDSNVKENNAFYSYNRQNSFMSCCKKGIENPGTNDILIRLSIHKSNSELQEQEKRPSKDYYSYLRETNKPTSKGIDFPEPSIYCLTQMKRDTKNEEFAYCKRRALVKNWENLMSEIPQQTSFYFKPGIEYKIFIKEVKINGTLFITQMDIETNKPEHNFNSNDDDCCFEIPTTTQESNDNDQDNIIRSGYYHPFSETHDIAMILKNREKKNTQFGMVEGAIFLRGNSSHDNQFLNISSLVSYPVTSGEILKYSQICKSKNIKDTDKNYKSPGLRLKDEYDDSTFICGHRGLGMNRDYRKGDASLQLGENTIVSMKEAIKVGAKMVEFDIQVTKDHVPVIYHDYTVTETGLKLFVGDLLSKEFTGINQSIKNNCGSNVIRRSTSSGNISEMNDLWKSSLKKTDDSKKFKGNGITTIFSDFTTLETVFEEMPSDAGFNLEIKYPIIDEIDWHQFENAYEINFFVDTIINQIFKSLVKKDRTIVLSSFHPGICSLLSHKIGHLVPVLFLTLGGIYNALNPGCNSIAQAMSTVNQYELSGIVSESGIYATSPRLISLLNRAGMFTSSYGSNNNVAEHVEIQRKYGMNMIIVDKVSNAVKVIRKTDGLRVDKLMEPYKNETNPNQKYLAPYLHDIIRGNGSFGISHTRVPTESRPGHVALIAGFYEDVSAVTKGWKMNPVEFDSVFNQSTHTWSFGSPDILPMFAHGASDKNKVETIMYPPDLENFAENAEHLDEFVFSKVDDMFKNAKTDFTLKTGLNQDGIVIFMHLLGIDTNGHGFRPHSSEYLNNIVLVDKIVQKTVKIVEDFYGNDGKTSYLFTADHGMGDRGVHGDGHPDNTMTPIIAWGAGVAKSPKLPHDSVFKGHDEISKNWKLEEYERKDINQADIAPLMSTLIGIPFPMNSVGHLPLSYIDEGEEFKANALFVNAKQILEQFEIKQDEKEKTRLGFTPFEPLSSVHENTSGRLSRIRQAIYKRDFSDAISQCNEAIELGLLGLRYYQKYDWVYLKSVVAAGYLGWIVFSLMFIFKIYIMDNPNAVKSHSHMGSSLPKTNTNLLSDDSADPESQEGEFEVWGPVQYFSIVPLVVLLFFVLSIQNVPYIYYTYIGFPVFFWIETFRQLPHTLNFAMKSNIFEAKDKGYLTAISCIVALEIIVFGYYDRRVYTAAMLILSVAWIFVVPKGVIYSNKLAIVGWVVSCVATSIFTLLPVEKGESIILCAIGGISITMVGIFACMNSRYFLDVEEYGGSKMSKNISSGSKQTIKNRAASEYKKNQAFLALQTFLVFFATIVVISTSISLKNKTGLPIINQYISWTLLFSSTAVPLAHFFLSNGEYGDQHYLHRMLTIFLAFATPMVLLTISYESLFYMFLSGTLFSWLHLERAIYNSKSSNLLLTNISPRLSDIQDSFRNKSEKQDLNRVVGSNEMGSVKSSLNKQKSRKPHIDDNIQSIFNDVVVALQDIYTILCGIVCIFDYKHDT
ncbi:hypothetical protein BB558_006280 [Smittium angustum]|uniref:GPI ethanolamine phosphate transferase 1 n=1 Tax=Smittium angustum TaxID=133377 RepID=A0A2U1IY67_SMIAN|nr:hypothetical protein BB558_006280 [Smittium angustum]